MQFKRAGVLNCENAMQGVGFGELLFWAEGPIWG
ncbi:hypothetical protein SEA_WATERT_116 [Microbacterium phage WaterT]|nr:hypothetical protein SEA_WATERT_116 [Microbacterium phage WaterT]